MNGKCRMKINGGMIKTTIREIKGSFGRYIAILAIVMLGVGLFSGLKATKPAMIATENAYLKTQNFFDFRLLSTIGFQEEDAGKLMELTEIEDAEGAVSVDVLGSFGDGNEAVYKIHTVPEKINRVVLTAGRMPKAADECLLDCALYGEDALGSKITVTDNNDGDTLEMLKERTFTAVGIVRSPYYINFERGTSAIGEGKITAFLYVPKDAFDCDYLTEIYLTTKQKYDVYTDGYEDYIDDMAEDVEQKTEELVQAGYTELTDEAQEKIDDAQLELDEKTAEAQAELDDAWHKIKKGRKKLKKAKKEILDGEKKAADGEKEIAEHEKEIADHEKELADGEREIQEKERELQDGISQVSRHESELSENEKELTAGRAGLNQAKQELQTQEASLLKQEASIAKQEKELTKKQSELNEQVKAADSQEAELDAKETELEGKKEQLEQAYAAQYISQEEYEGGMAQIQAGMAQIQSGREEIKAGKKKLQEGLSQLQSGLTQIQSGKKEIESGRQQIDSAKNEIAKKEQELLSADAQLTAARKELADARAELESGRVQLANAKAELADGRTQLEEGKAELASAKAELADARAELKKGRRKLKDGRRELADAKIEYEDAKEEFEEKTADAQKKIDDAQEELEELEERDDYVLDRNTNIGYACYESDANIVAAIANVFPVFFFLVAALVCMTTMNRMIEEQRTQIGVLKALGYGNSTIMGKYLFYAGSAAAVGAAAGCMGGTWLFPKVIWMGYSIMYSMGDIMYLFDIRLAVLSMAAALLCSVGAAYLSCRYELHSVPANLIRPKAPKSGRRIFLERIPLIWSRMEFLHKVSVRNVVRYKKRFFMMILGIGGCTALLVTGFGIKDSVTNIAEMQYDEVHIYDIGITFTDGVRQIDVDELSQRMEGKLSQIACLYEESVDLDFGGRTKSVYMEIPENTERFISFLDLHTRSGEKIAYPAVGEAVLTETIAEKMGIHEGDTVTLRDNDMNSLSVTVSALCENFVYNYIYISKETYAAQIGAQPEYKSAYACVKDSVDVHAASAQLSDMDDVLAVSVTQDMRDRIANMMQSMDYIVLLIIVCAGSLAFIVLYNLTNINITERIREIATIKVLGFYAKETADYVFRENLVLTGLGAVVGLGLGKWLHWFVMYHVRIDMLSFKTLIVPVSYLWSLLFTFGFAMLVNGLMYFKLEKINMAESLKSIE